MMLADTVDIQPDLIRELNFLHEVAHALVEAHRLSSGGVGRGLCEGVDAELHGIESTGRPRLAVPLFLAALPRLPSPGRRQPVEPGFSASREVSLGRRPGGVREPGASPFVSFTRAASLFAGHAPLCSAEVEQILTVIDVALSFSTPTSMTEPWAAGTGGDSAPRSFE